MTDVPSEEADPARRGPAARRRGRPAAGLVGHPGAPAAHHGARPGGYLVGRRGWARSVSARPFPSSLVRYRTILADPPWGTRNQQGGYGAVRHYPLMPTAEIGALPV